MGWELRVPWMPVPKSAEAHQQPVCGMPLVTYGLLAFALAAVLHRLLELLPPTAECTLVDGMLVYHNWAIDDLRKATSSSQLL